jgi:hypothetical protein
MREEHRLRVFENRVLRRIFGPKKDEDGWRRKLHNDEFHSLYSSPNINKVTKSKRLRWAGYVARMVEGRGVTGFWMGGPKRRDHWKDLGVGERITLRCTLGVDGTNWIRLAQDTIRWRAFENTVMNLQDP